MATLRSDIQSANERGRLTKRRPEVDLIERQLADGEKVERMLLGRFTAGRGVLVLTDRRILWLRGKKPDLGDVAISEVTNVAFVKTTKMTGDLTIGTVDASADVKMVLLEEGRDFAEKLQELRGEEAPAEVARDDPQGIIAATERMALKMGAKRELKKLPEQLHGDEFVVELARGKYGGGIGVLALTRRRLLFLRDSWTGAAHEDFPLSKVTTVGFSSKLGTGKVTIHASGNVTTIEEVMSDDGKRLVAAARSELERLHEPTPHPPTTPDPGSDALSKLKQLGELRDAGVLTDEEFALKKSQLLDQI